jgi:glycosyltransferase involved in cell wall biosynthesis
MERKRVLMIIPNMDFGGAQNSFARVSLLLESDYLVQVVVFNKDNMAPIKLGGQLHNLAVDGSSFFIGKFINFLKRVIRLRSLKKQFKPHISISFLEGADYVNVLSSCGERIYLYLHGSKLFDRNIKGLMGILRKKVLIPFFYAKASKILVVNQAIANELRNNFGLKRMTFEVMPNFYDFKQIRTKAGIAESQATQIFFSTNKVICISGRLAPEKGIDRFVKILPTLFTTFSNLKVILVGDGPELNNIQQELLKMSISFKTVDQDADWNDESKVLFLGYRSNPYPYISNSFLLALPSLNEGMPNTVVEAMGLGTPVVAADCPYGPRELLADNEPSNEWPEFAKYGVLVPVLDNSDAASHWVSALHTMLSDVAKRDHYRMIGLTRSEEFSQERNVKRWHNLLEA